MNFLLLGHGKTGSLVAAIAHERGHQTVALTSSQNKGAHALTPDRLRGIDAVIDFTTPEAVIPNIEACCRAQANIVVGTTGWYGDIPRVQELVEQSGNALVYASNFSVGVNLFFDIARLAGVAARHGYDARIVERHHIHKKDKPSGTAISIASHLAEGTTDDMNAGAAPETTSRQWHLSIPIESIREGEIVGEHTIILESPADTITLQHSAKSRRGFAEGAVAAAEWIKGKRGFYEFHDILPEL